MKVEMVPIGTLKENPENPRRISRAELIKLKRSLKEFGWVDPVIVNKHKGRENIIIGGHQRIKAARDLGYTEVPVTWVDLPKHKEETLNIALNKISGEWDEDKLTWIMADLMEQEGFDVTLTGFDEADIDVMINDEDEEQKKELLNTAPEPPETTDIKLGDRFKLGRHILQCGNSTKPEDFKKLMGTTKADLCWTDPPYGVSYRGQSNHEVMKNDDLTGEEQ